MVEKVRKRPADKREIEESERELDEGLKETFPTSDPVSITQPGGHEDPAVVRKKKEKEQGRD